MALARVPVLALTALFWEPIALSADHWLAGQWLTCIALLLVSIGLVTGAVRLLTGRGRAMLLWTGGILAAVTVAGFVTIAVTLAVTLGLVLLSPVFLDLLSPVSLPAMVLSLSLVYLRIAAGETVGRWLKMRRRDDTKPFQPAA